MCGIAMIVGDGWDPATFRSMIDAIEHRGTVTEVATSDGCAAATRRLPIVDRERAIQPRILQTPSVQTLCYNGELYNTRELRVELARRSRVPSTASDTELLALSLAEWGEDAVSRISGEFAFAVEVNGAVYVGRDPFGVKPLYYAISDGRIHVASEIKALVSVGTRVVEVLPGQHGWITGDGAQIRSYYDVGARLQQAESDGLFTCADDAAAAVRETVTQAIAARVRTDLPLAVILSGGLDSSIVATVASRFHRNVVAYTIGTADSPDLDYATRVARDLGLPHQVIEVAPKEFGRAALLDAVESSELTEYGDIINAAISARLFRAIGDDGMRVAIGGDCSDELFGGYPMYRDIPVQQQQRLFVHKLRNLGRTELQRVDRTSMAATVEARVPFLDPRVVDVALRVPTTMKTVDGVEKWILRRAFGDLLPDYVVARPKHGLSYSSGLHDRLRLYKPWVAGHYRRSGYAQHAPLRRDFDTVLTRAGNDLDRALSGPGLLSDHTAAEKSRDLLGALRWNLVAELPRRSSRRSDETALTVDEGQG